jgi:hypothetical protein
VIVQREDSIKEDEKVNRIEKKNCENASNSTENS